MPFRERAKNLFKTKSRTGSLSTTATNDSSSRERYPSNVYAPGEPMPRPKYRATPKKEHTEKLESFSFKDAWRKKSFQSSYSPMGTRAPSRHNSIFSVRRKSGSRRNSNITRNSSIASNDGTNGAGPKHKTAAMAVQPEQEGDDDVTNVGLSRIQSKDNPIFPPPHIADARPVLKTTSTAHDHQPFSEHDLALALHRSHIAVPTAS